MPQIRPEILQIGALFLCVPLQYLLVQYWSNNQSSQTQELKDLLSNVVQFHHNYLRWESWRRWCVDVLLNLKDGGDRKSDLYKDDPDDPMGESPAIEVMKYKQKEGYFGASPEPRSPRAAHVKYRVGQVITHKQWKYRGVIVGWDETARAPDDWLDEMHGKSHPHWRKMPNYAILVDIRDRMTPQITYVAEENIEVVKNTKIIHPVTDDFFETFDGAQYIPRPWLKTLYPYD